jgi:hypothetical protein
MFPAPYARVRDVPPGDFTVIVPRSPTLAKLFACHN